MHERRAEVEECEFSEDDTLGDWPGEMAEKGAISLHRDILTSELRPEVLLRFSKNSAALASACRPKIGGWIDCPDSRSLPSSALHDTSILAKKEFGAEIFGVSGEVIECIVKNQLCDQEAGIKRSWQ